MRKLTILVSAAAIFTAVIGVAVPAGAQPYGSGMMGGHGMMGGYGPMMGGYGMMGGGYGGCGMMGGGGCGMMGGYGPGPMMGYGPGYYGNQPNLNLTVDNVKNYLGRMIAIQGNTRLKVGDVKEKDGDTIIADIVTKENSLVQRFNVDRHTGFYRPEETQ
jgi:hypothetical protein